MWNVIQNFRMGFSLYTSEGSQKTAEATIVNLNEDMYNITVFTNEYANQAFNCSVGVVLHTALLTVQPVASTPHLS